MRNPRYGLKQEYRPLEIGLSIGLGVLWTILKVNIILSIRNIGMIYGRMKVITVNKHWRHWRQWCAVLIPPEVELGKLRGVGKEDIKVIPACLASPLAPQLAQNKHGERSASYPGALIGFDVA